MAKELVNGLKIKKATTRVDSGSIVAHSSNYCWKGFFQGWEQSWQEAGGGRWLNGRGLERDFGISGRGVC